jgi:hypothetical protein
MAAYMPIPPMMAITEMKINICWGYEGLMGRMKRVPK